MVKPCSKDSKNIVYRKFEAEFNDVQDLYDHDRTGLVTEYQADEIMVALGFVDPKQNHDLDCTSELLNYLRGGKHPEHDGDEKASIKISDLKTILTAILNFEFQWMLTDQPN